MNKQSYTAPSFSIEEVIVESGIAASPAWGDYGKPGQNGDYIIYEEDL